MQVSTMDLKDFFNLVKEKLSFFYQISIFIGLNFLLEEKSKFNIAIALDPPFTCNLFHTMNETNTKSS